MTRAYAPPPAAFDPTDDTAPARVAWLVDAFELRIRRHAALLDLYRAHLDVRGPGRARTAVEHALDLVELGLRWLDDRGRDGGDARREPLPGELDRTIARAAAEGCREPELRRLRGWRDLIDAEGAAEVVPDATDLAAWFDEMSRASLGRDAGSLEDRIALARTEIVSRRVRGRPGTPGGSGIDPRGQALPLHLGAERARG